MKCIFETDELKECCKMLKCPVNNDKDKCIAKAYVSLIENYVKLKNKGIKAESTGPEKSEK